MPPGARDAVGGYSLFAFRYSPFAGRQSLFAVRFSHGTELAWAFFNQSKTIQEPINLSHKFGFERARLHRPLKKSSPERVWVVRRFSAASSEYRETAFRPGDIAQKRLF